MSSPKTATNAEERRAHPRYAIKNTTASVDCGGTGVAQYSVLNFSAGGLLLGDGPPLTLGMELNIRLRLPSQNAIELMGTVVRLTGGQKAAYGIAFGALNADLEDMLQDAILSVLEEHRVANLPRILIVDDSPEVARAIKRDLHWFGGLIDIATTTAEALELARRETKPPRAAIVDLYVGADDGLQVLQTMREELPELRCVLMSGAVRHHQLRLAQIGGRVDHVLPKPWSKEMLQDAIGDLRFRPGPENTGC